MFLHAHLPAAFCAPIPGITGVTAANTKASEDSSHPPAAFAYPVSNKENTMSEAALSVTERSADTTLSFFQSILKNYHPRNFAVQLWDGQVWDAEPGQEVRFTLVLKHPGALRKMFWPLSNLTLGEAFIHDDFDIEGDIESAFALGDFLLSAPWKITEKIRLGTYLLTLPGGESPESGHDLQLEGERHSRERDRTAVTYHYDVSNDFFSCFLDERMLYSCAYFRSMRDDLNTAQEQKLDYICRKLRLNPGDRVLDIGCGWGGLVMHAVAKYGADVVGVTISREQANLARERIKAAGLKHFCHVELVDYRDFNDVEGFHKIVSVGMFEHVGEAQLPEYFSKAWSLLQPGGIFLNHGISDHIAGHGKGGVTFSSKHVFPDSETVPLSTVLRVAEETGFEIRDVESLREHYAMTLRHWVANLEKSRDRALTHVDETTWRIWRLYMAGSAHRFKSGRLNVYQTLLVKPNRGMSGLPLTRDDWYA